MDELFGKGGLGELMQQLQGAQSRIQEMQRDMATRRFDGEAGGGLVRVQVSGDMHVVAVRIDPKAADPADTGMLEDLIQTATNRALAGARDAVASQMGQGLLGSMMGG